MTMITYQLCYNLARSTRSGSTVPAIIYAQIIGKRFQSYTTAMVEQHESNVFVDLEKVGMRGDITVL